MAYIDRNFVTNRLIPAVSITDLIGSYLPLKRAGRDYSCCCPFHQEKSPSFTVSETKQMFYCFGCKEHGNALDFLIKYKHITFPEAVEELASFCGMEVVYEGGRQGGHKNEKKDKLFRLNDDVAVYFQRKLLEDRRAMDYWTKTRRLSQDIITKYRLGYAPDSFDYLKKEFIQNPQQEKDMLELGLLKPGQSGKGSYCAFRDRVMIPITDSKGRVIAFGGRIISTEAHQTAKYINSPTSGVYEKGRELFGLYDVLRAHNNRPERIVVVEGYMDVISLAMAGVDYAVASLGTATTDVQLKLAFRFTDEIVFCYDGDSAGHRAAFSALETVTPLLTDGGKSVRFAFLPEEHDPDSLVQEQGQEGFNRVLGQSMAYSEYLIGHTMAEYDLSDPNGMSGFLRTSLQLISKIKSDPLREVTINLLAERSHMEVDRILSMLADLKTQGRQRRITERQSGPGPAAVVEGNLLSTPMRGLMAFVLQEPNIVSHLIEDLRLETFVSICERLGVKGLAEFTHFLSLIESKGDITPAELLEGARDTDYYKMVDMLINARMYGKTESYDLQSEKAKGEMFITLLNKVIFDGLQKKSEEVKFSAGAGSKENEALVYAINRIRAMRFD